MLVLLNLSLIVNTTTFPYLFASLCREPVVESDKIRQVLEKTSLSGWKREAFLLVSWLCVVGFTIHNPLCCALIQ